jgi:hypothetical protein
VFVAISAAAVVAAIAVSLATTGSKRQAAAGTWMGAAPARSASPLGLPGERVNVVLELERSADGLLRGRFLEPAGANAFRRTSRPVAVRLALASIRQ